MDDFSSFPSMMASPPLRNRSRAPALQATQGSEASFVPPSDDTISPTPTPRRVPSREAQNIPPIDLERQRAVQLPLPDEQYQIATLQVAQSPHDYSAILASLGCIAIIDAAFTESQRCGHVFFNHTDTIYSRLDLWKQHCVQILADTPLTMLQALLDNSLCGRVLAARLEDEQLTMHFDEARFNRSLRHHLVGASHWISRQIGAFAPAIYTIIFADRMGESPTPSQLRKIILWLHRYISGDDRYVKACTEIDNQSRLYRSEEANIRAGQHFHLQGKKERVKQLITFATALSKTLDEEAPENTTAAAKPFKHHLKYFGFTSNSTSQAAGHEAGNTTWLKALFEDICKHLFRNSGVPVFTFHTYTIAYPISHAECKLAEELFCRIGNSYYYTGLGFNMADAGMGVNTTQVGQLRLSDAVELWQERETLRYKNPLFEPQITEDLTIKHELYQQEIAARDEYTRLIAKRDDLLAQVEAARLTQTPNSVLDARQLALHASMQDLLKVYPEGGITRRYLARCYADFEKFVEKVKRQWAENDITLE